MRIRSALVALSLLALPLLARAENAVTFRLDDADERNQWNATNVSGVVPQEDGIRISGPTEVALTRNIVPSFPIAVVEVRYSSDAGGPLAFLWRRTESSDVRQFHQIPVTLQPRTEPATFTLALSAVGNWDPRPQAIGFRIPPGADMTIHAVTLRGWSAAERLTEALRCFWTSDTFGAHSINFLWGPLLCSSPIQREHLYDQQPPAAHSGMRAIYLLWGVGSLVVGALCWSRRRRLRPGAFLRGTLLLALALWIVLDLRMGMEFFRNLRADAHSYISEPIGKRVFRTIRFLPDFAVASLGILRDQPRYVFLAPTTDTFMNYMRYATYPSAPVNPDAGSGASLWLVYGRPDMAIDPRGRITEQGVPLSPPGSLVHEFMKGTFIFRVTP